MKYYVNIAKFDHYNNLGKPIYVFFAKAEINCYSLENAKKIYKEFCIKFPECKCTLMKINTVWEELEEN